jgi:hypothetical protein
LAVGGSAVGFVDGLALEKLLVERVSVLDGDLGTLSVERDLIVTLVGFVVFVTDEIAEGLFFDDGGVIVDGQDVDDASALFGECQVFVPNDKIQPENTVDVGLTDNGDFPSVVAFNVRWVPRGQEISGSQQLSVGTILLSFSVLSVQHGVASVHASVPEVGHSLHLSAKDGVLTRGVQLTSGPQAVFVISGERESDKSVFVEGVGVRNLLGLPERNEDGRIVDPFHVNGEGNLRSGDLMRVAVLVEHFEFEGENNVIGSPVRQRLVGREVKEFAIGNDVREAGDVDDTARYAGIQNVKLAELGRSGQSETRSGFGVGGLPVLRDVEIDEDGGSSLSGDLARTDPFDGLRSRLDPNLDVVVGRIQRTIVVDTVIGNANGIGFGIGNVGGTRSVDNVATGDLGVVSSGGRAESGALAIGEGTARTDCCASELSDDQLRIGVNVVSREVFDLLASVIGVIDDKTFALVNPELQVFSTRGLIHRGNVNGGSVSGALKTG